MVYDPCIGQFDIVQQTIPVVPFVQANQEFFGFDEQTMAQLASAHHTCGFDQYISEYLTFPPPRQQPQLTELPYDCNLANTVSNQATEINPCFNIYEVNTTCPEPSDQLGQDNSSPYFNRADVKKAIHAPASTTWGECNGRPFAGYGGPENEGDTSADSIQHALPQVIEGTNRVIVSNGDYDMIIITNGTLLSIQNMTWNGNLGFQNRPSQPVILPDGSIGGLQHQERGLLFTESFKAGHQGPEYAPFVAYRQMQWLLGHIDSL